ncbi:MAG: HDIG domain-containing protein [Chloroflexi bacterium]|nr:HDIG domain-containing protein [Chloroflexota bacterium]
MADVISQERLSLFSRSRFFPTLLLGLTALLSAVALLMPTSSNQSSLALEVGDVAGQDVLAPRTLSYESAVLTEQLRAESAEGVVAVYGPPDANVAREQVERLEATLAFITTVRLDSLASNEEKLSDLAALQNINLGQERAIEILDLSESAWQSVEQESNAVLEQVMRSTIRQDRLEEARRSVPALVSLSVPQNQAEIAADLAAAFVAPNSFFSESLTEAARNDAQAVIEPVTRTYLSDETIVQRGQIVTEVELEALQEFGLVQPETRWQDYVGVAALVLIIFAITVLYLRSLPEGSFQLRSMLLVIVLFLVFLFAARLFATERTVVPYIFPIAGFGLLVSTLLRPQPAIIFSLALSVLAAYNQATAFELTLYYFFSSVVGILVLQNAQRIITYLTAGGAVSLAGAAVLLAYRLPLASTDLVGLATLFGASIIYGFGSGTLTIVLQLVLAQFLGLTTTIQLLELARPDHPLLQFILRNAPGTYQHSLQIANLAEQAAEGIGADALLTRVGALYHDAGKARQPIYFIENQVPGSPNPHDELAPTESAKIIIRHVSDGLELADKHRVPGRVKDFIAEHHGTMITRYQYVKAVEAAGGDENKINKEDFRYPGPRPGSRETALVMLADGCEARTRAERPETREELNVLVKSIIDQRLAQDQLDDTSLTMKDLTIIQDSFVSALRGVYHPRLLYPEIEGNKVEAMDIQPQSETLSNKQ